jgi:chromosome partitioning protein
LQYLHIIFTPATPALKYKIMNSISGLEKVLDTHQKVVLKDYVAPKGQGFKSYAVTNLRGGVGKSSIAFNLAFEMSRRHNVLFSDLCPQCNFTELLLGDAKPKVTINDGLRPTILGSAFGDIPDDLCYRVSQYCDSFKGGKKALLIPGDQELFAFPTLKQ